MILVERRIHRGNDPLAERIVERVVDGRRQDAETRGNFAVHRDIKQWSGILLIGGDICDARNGLDLVEEKGRPAIELAGVGVGQCVLILSLG